MATQFTTPPIYASREWVIKCNEIIPPEESMCPCRVKVSWNNPSHDELLRVFFCVCEMNFGWTNFRRRALATSAATCCGHVMWILIDVPERYDCCPTQRQTRPIEIPWISTAQAGLTHQQNRNLSCPRGVEVGIHQGQVWGDRWPMTFASHYLTLERDFCLWAEA